jgi:Asp-tRNA(Asn)/Glu-tRNA(Gln) amidotransferase A subunit family amidase
VSQAASLLSQSGCYVDAFRPDGLEEARQLWWQFFGTAGGMILGPMLRGHEVELSPILREFSSWTSAEPAHTGESFLATWLARDEIREKVLVQMRKYPVLLCPTAAIPAFRHGEREWEVEGKTVEYLDAWSYCEWFNLLGFPAVVVPMRLSPEGLPISIQIVGRPWEEELVLAVAQGLKQRGRIPAAIDDVAPARRRTAEAPVVFCTIIPARAWITLLNLRLSGVFVKAAVFILTRSIKNMSVPVSRLLRSCCAR